MASAGVQGGVRVTPRNGSRAPGKKGQRSAHIKVLSPPRGRVAYV